MHNKFSISIKEPTTENESLFQAVEFGLQYLFNGYENTIENIHEVAIYFSNDMKKSLNTSHEKNTDGLTRDYEVGDKKGFKVWINTSRSMEKQLLTLFHELVHVRQYVVKNINLSEEEEDELQYYNEEDPYEEEAYGLENEIYQAWLKHETATRRV